MYALGKAYAGKKGMSKMSRKIFAVVKSVVEVVEMAMRIAGGQGVRTPPALRTLAWTQQ